jgi:hypothetical protein
MQSTCLSPYSQRPNAPGDPATARFVGSHVQFYSFFNLEFKFLLMHGSNFHFIEFSYGSNTCDAVGRVSRNRAYFDVATTATCSWILASTSSKWILATTTSNRASRLEFQHSSPTFRAGILAAAMGTPS